MCLLQDKLNRQYKKQ